MHNSCTTKAMQSGRASPNSECSGTLIVGCRAKASARMSSIRRRLDNTSVRDKKTGKLRNGDTAALARMLRMLRPRLAEIPPASDSLSDCSVAVSAVFAAGARIVRTDDCAPHASRKGVPRGVSSGWHLRLSSDFPQRRHRLCTTPS
jgi:hypothetical protein